MHLGIEEGPVLFWGHCELDIVSGIISSLGFQIWCMDAFLDDDMLCIIFGSP